jgi:hypothetical protein
MAQRFTKLEKKYIGFFEKQHLFFIATTGTEGTVNVSPKGMDTLRVVDSNTVVWLNHTGSGNETSVHIQENGRMTIMFCSFDKKPLILRLYGEAKVVHRHDAKWGEYGKIFDDYVGVRQYFEMNISLVQTSCGFAVPFYEYKGERDTLIKWADGLGRDGIEDYWKNKNQISLDGKQTNIVNNKI